MKTPSTDTPHAMPGSESAPVGADRGDPVCWLAQVCIHCGALSDVSDAVCWRCGESRPPAGA